MIFHPQNVTGTEGKFTFSGEVEALAHPCLNRAVIKEFWRNFSFQASTVNVSETHDYSFSVGNAKPLPLDGWDYSIHIESDGVCVCAENEKDLIRGFMTLLDRFVAVDADGTPAIEIGCCQIRDKAMIPNRMVHFCIFPETELWELQRFIRFCGALKYTHAVLEFWGMLKYDCMKELGWSHAFTKEQIKPIIREANDLGLEIIPMFNHWGHASSGREMHGKHVVLDQNPALQTYFSEDGWCWDIRKAKVRDLMRSIRAELIELCGEGSYFHIGCDEAYGFAFTEENMDLLCDYVNGISEDLKKHDRRAIMWGDMLLYRYEHYHPTNRYACSAPTPEAEGYLLGRLSRDVVIADWQYDAKVAPVETTQVFTQAGFDCILCPWDRGIAQTKSAISTVQDKALMGMMHTTWHTLSSGMPFVMLAARGFDRVEGHGFNIKPAGTAALLRKVMPIDGDYEKAGWGKIEVHCKW